MCSDTSSDVSRFCAEIYFFIGTFAVISLMLGSALEKFLLVNPLNVLSSSNSTTVATATMSDAVFFASTTADRNANTLGKFTALLLLYFV